MTKTATVHAQQRWEYMTISRKTDTYLAQELNTLGQDGWDLVTINYAQGKTGEMFWTAFLKRPAAGHPAAETAQESTPTHHAPAPASPNPTTPPATTPTPTPQGFDDDGDMFAIHEEPDKPE